MGNAYCGLRIRLIFMICIFLVAMTRECVGGGNLTTISCSEQERLALLKFKRSIRDDYGILSSWGDGNDCCTWERIGCDDASGRVISLHLRREVMEDYYFVNRDNDLHAEQDYNFIGVDDGYYLVSDEMNSCLMELVNLKHLDLSGIYFQRSRIPEFIGSFKQLRYLNLSSTGFIGNIPHQIGNLSNLKVLDLNSLEYYSREFTTDDMAWISSLSKLESLDLSGVNLSRVKNLNNLLYMIPSLLKLSLSGCRLPMANLGSCHHNSSRILESIKHLDLSENVLGGQLPGLFLNMTSLVFLDLSSNEVSVAWSFKNFLNMIPSVLELRFSNQS